MAIAAPRPAPEKPLVLLAGFEPAEAEACRRLLRGETDSAEIEVLEADSDLPRRLERQRVAVLCLGPRISGLQARRVLDGAKRLPHPPGPPTLTLLTAAGPDPTLFQELIDEDRIFYLSSQPVPLDDLA